jgi:hypothetical protein
MYRIVFSFILLVLITESSFLKLSPQVAKDLDAAGKADILVVMEQKVNLDKFFNTKMDHVTKGRVIVSEVILLPIFSIP